MSRSTLQLVSLVAFGLTWFFGHLSQALTRLP